MICYNNLCAMIETSFYWKDSRSEAMSAAELKEIVSFIGIGLLIMAIALIQLARRKLSGIFSLIVSMLAYVCLVVGALIVFYVVISGPTG
ncbi:DUF2768 domain-containing protein [Pseudogracilibacillus auburnensis]